MSDNMTAPESHTAALHDEIRAVEPDDPYWYKPTPDEYEEPR